MLKKLSITLTAMMLLQMSQSVALAEELIKFSCDLNRTDKYTSGEYIIPVWRIEGTVIRSAITDEAGFYPHGGLITLYLDAESHPRKIVREATGRARKGWLGNLEASRVPGISWIDFQIRLIENAVPGDSTYRGSHGVGTMNCRQLMP